MYTNYEDDPLMLCRGDNGNMTIDKTFPARFKNFVEHCVKYYGAGDFIVDEEGEYMKYMADKFIEYQINTANSIEENTYFHNLSKK